MKEIRVTTQAELDTIPENYDGYIKIYGKELIKVSKKYTYAVRVYENSTVVACDNSSVSAYGNSIVSAHNNSIVFAYGKSSVVAYDNSRVVAAGDSFVETYGNSRVDAFNNSAVYAHGESSVCAYEKSTVSAWGNVQVLELSAAVRTAIKGNARAVKKPNSLEDFIKYYDVKSTKTTVTLYKAVHKIADKYFSDYKHGYEYKIGEKRVEQCDTHTGKDCSYGLHLAPLYKAVEYGKNWEDLAILECETKKTNIVVPKNNDGKIRTSELTVMREIPLEECGILGEMIAKRNDDITRKKDVRA